MVIRKASLADLEIIINVGKETFFETFADNNSDEAMSKYLLVNFEYDKIKIELENQNSIFFIALDNDNVAGYLKLNSGAAQTDIQNENSLEIQRIYVRGSYQGKKIGQLLFDKATEIAMEQMREFIWLGVWEKNLKAIMFYEKNGFTIFDKHLFVMGDDELTDFMMKKVL